jgi:predicted small lipoprotein YifL
VEIVALKRKLSVLIGAMTLAASLTACGSGGETDDGNSGDSSPTAEPTADDGDDGDPEGSQSGGNGSGD